MTEKRRSEVPYRTLGFNQIDLEVETLPKSGRVVFEPQSFAADEWLMDNTDDIIDWRLTKSGRTAYTKADADKIIAAARADGLGVMEF